jgi:hypothetical protein
MEKALCKNQSCFAILISLKAAGIVTDRVTTKNENE